MTTYLEVKIWSLPKHENLTTGKKYCGKEERAISRLFHNIFNISNFKNLIIYLLNVVNQIIFLRFCKSDMSKYGYLLKYMYFRESLGIRDNESRLYLIVFQCKVNARMRPCAYVGSCESAHFAHARRYIFAWRGPCEVNSLYVLKCQNKNI